MNQVYVGFRVELAALPDLHPGPECLDARFFSEEAWPVSELAFDDMVPDRPADIFRRLRAGDFAVKSLTFRPVGTFPEWESRKQGKAQPRAQLAMVPSPQPEDLRAL